MAGHDIVVIGGSAGGIEALRRICEGLPPDFPAAVVVVLHISPKSRSVMPDLLSRAGKLPARHPQDDEPINAARSMSRRPTCTCCCDRATSSCGAAHTRTGLARNRSAVPFRRGGLRVTRDRRAAERAARRWLRRPARDQVMRRALCRPGAERCDVVGDATQRTGPRQCRPLRAGRGNAGPAGRLVQGAGQAAAADPRPPGRGDKHCHAGVADGAESPSSWVPSHLSCPQCGGVLNEVAGRRSTRFRCQIGHAFTAETLLAAQDDELERAMDSALRMHRERVVLFRRMQEKSEAQAMPHAAARWRTGADELEHAAKVIGEALINLRRHGGVVGEHDTFAHCGACGWMDSRLRGNDAIRSTLSARRTILEHNHGPIVAAIVMEQRRDPTRHFIPRPRRSNASSVASLNDPIALCRGVPAPPVAPADRCRVRPND